MEISRTQHLVAKFTYPQEGRVFYNHMYLMKNIGYAKLTAAFNNAKRPRTHAEGQKKTAQT
jgi:hypothetical protein